jgi:integrase/recombinase XerD
MDRRQRLGINGRRRLFCRLDGGPLDQSYVRHLLRRLAGKAGIDKRVHPHGLRHTYAAELAREGVPMNVLRDALGHSTLATTDRYLRDVAPVHVIETMRRREWRL